MSPSVQRVTNCTYQCTVREHMHSTQACVHCTCHTHHMRHVQQTCYEACVNSTCNKHDMTHVWSATNITIHVQETSYDSCVNRNKHDMIHMYSHMTHAMHTCVMTCLLHVQFTLCIVTWHMSCDYMTCVMIIFSLDSCVMTCCTCYMCNSHSVYSHDTYAWVCVCVCDTCV